jgi:hypothetical protein
MDKYKRSIAIPATFADGRTDVAVAGSFDVRIETMSSPLATERCSGPSAG